MDDALHIKETIATAFKVDVATITDETRLKEDLNAKSSGYFTIIAELEELADKKVTYAQLRKCKTVGDVCAFLEQLKAE